MWAGNPKPKPKPKPEPEPKPNPNPNPAPDPDPDPDPNPNPNPKQDYDRLFFCPAGVQRLAFDAQLEVAADCGELASTLTQPKRYP